MKKWNFESYKQVLVVENGEVLKSIRIPAAAQVSVIEMKVTKEDELKSQSLARALTNPQTPQNFDVSAKAFVKYISSLKINRFSTAAIMAAWNYFCDPKMKFISQNMLTHHLIPYFKAVGFYKVPGRTHKRDRKRLALLAQNDSLAAVLEKSSPKPHDNQKYQIFIKYDDLVNNYPTAAKKIGVK